MLISIIKHLLSEKWNIVAQITTFCPGLPCSRILKIINEMSDFCCVTVATHSTSKVPAKLDLTTVLDNMYCQ